MDRRLDCFATMQESDKLTNVLQYRVLHSIRTVKINSDYGETKILVYKPVAGVNAVMFA